jgi:RimJ/RimL family protein N-acetyltransferase
VYFKKLIGKQCYLSPIDPADAEKFTGWLNDLEITVNLQVYSAVIGAENERSLLQALAKQHNYSIVDIKTDELIGNCGFLDIDPINQTAEAGIFIGSKNHWSKGYGTEALSLLLYYGFMALNFRNVLIRVYGFNTRAVKAYEKIGFKQIGIRRQALHRNRETHDIFYMDILPDEFYARFALYSSP